MKKTLKIVVLLTLININFSANAFKPEKELIAAISVGAAAGIFNGALDCFLFDQPINEDSLISSSIEKNILELQVYLIGAVALLLKNKEVLSIVSAYLIAKNISYIITTTTRTTCNQQKTSSL